MICDVSLRAVYGELYAAITACRWQEKPLNEEVPGWACVRIIEYLQIDGRPM